MMAAAFCDECGADLAAADAVQVGVFFYPGGITGPTGPSQWQYSTLCGSCYLKAADAFPAAFGVRRRNSPLT